MNENKRITELYRYESRYRDEWSEGSIILLTFTVVRETDCYYFIQVDYKSKKIKKIATSTFAYDTKEKAWLNYKLRTKNYINILENKIKNVKDCYKLAKEYKGNITEENYRIYKEQENKLADPLRE
jgi:hypothetical protein